PITANVCVSKTYNGELRPLVRPFLLVRWYPTQAEAKTADMDCDRQFQCCVFLFDLVPHFYPGMRFDSFRWPPYLVDTNPAALARARVSVFRDSSVLSGMRREALHRSKFTAYLDGVSG